MARAYPNIENKDSSCVSGDLYPSVPLIRLLLAVRLTSLVPSVHFDVWLRLFRIFCRRTRMSYVVRRSDFSSIVTVIGVSWFSRCEPRRPIRPFTLLVALMEMVR